MSRRWNVAVVGATGLVGGNMLSILEQREFPGRRGACARERALGRAHGALPRPRSAGAGPRDLRFLEGADRAVLGRRQRFQGARGARRQSRLHRDRQHLAVPLPGRHPAGGQRGESARDRRLPQAQHHRQPELLDHADAGGAEAAARRRADRAHQRRDLPVGLGRRAEGDRRAGAADRGARPGRQPSRRK